MKIKSIFETVAPQIFIMKNVDEMKTYVREFVEGKGIADDDKQRILNNIHGIKTAAAFQTYICNSLLMYKGMGLNKVHDSGSK